MKRFFAVLLFSLMIAYFSAMLLFVSMVGCFSEASAEDEGPIFYLTEKDQLPGLRSEDLLEIHFLSINAADCILIRMGDSAVLVDSGRRGTASKAASYLKEVGIEAFVCVFLTHPHDDHVGGYPGILEEIKTSAFFQAALYETFKSQAMDKLNQTLEKQNILNFMIPNEWTMHLGEATLSFYQWQNPESAQNDRSVVIKVTYGERSALLSADLENEGQKALAEMYGEALKADILKMPHHGIGTYQLPFHEAVQPLLGVVSNAKNRIPDTIEAMTKRGMQWRLTPWGAVVAVSDGNSWYIWQDTEGN